MILIEKAGSTVSQTEDAAKVSTAKSHVYLSDEPLIKIRRTAFLGGDQPARVVLTGSRFDGKLPIFGDNA